MILRHAATAIALVLAAPALAQAPVPAAPGEIAVQGRNQQREFRCEGQDVTLSGEGHRVTLSGACGVVLVEGFGHVVTLADAARLEVTGAQSSVTASGGISAIAIFGRRHQVVAAIPVATRPAAIELHGEGSVLRVALNGPARAELDGAGNRILWTKADGVPDPVGDVSGHDNRLERAAAQP